MNGGYPIRVPEDGLSNRNSAWTGNCRTATANSNVTAGWACTLEPLCTATASADSGQQSLATVARWLGPSPSRGPGGRGTGCPRALPQSAAELCGPIVQGNSAVAFAVVGAVVVAVAVDTATVTPVPAEEQPAKTPYPFTEADTR